MSTRAWSPKAPYVLLAVLALAALDLHAQEQDPDIESLTSLSLQELLSVEVVSVSKTARKLSDSAAAVYVITSEQIRRSGATTLPELLRTVPGLQVARIDGNKWAISARGFSGRFANKLLVLMDGRSVYTPLFSGVFWELQDTLLEDIERIEIVRGPGATLWGANAVNGIINIITKAAAETRGILATTSYGAVEGVTAGFRYGGSLGDEGDWRFFARAFDRDPTRAVEGGDAADGWDTVRGGMRIDFRPAAGTTVQVQANAYSGKAGSTYVLASPAPPFASTLASETRLDGGNAMVELRRTLDDTSSIVVRAYYDRTERQDGFFGEVRNSYDLEALHELALGRHHVVWGAGYRSSSDRIDNSFTISLDPARRTTGLFNAFVQDDISLAGDAVRLTLGTKLEHNDYTGWELQPNARFLWHVDDRHTIWGAVSRAVRTPSRVEQDGRIVQAILPPGHPMNPSPFPLGAVILGNEDFDSERLRAYELGYRVRASDRVSFDVAAFVNDYNDLRDATPAPPFPGPQFLVAPIVIVNGVTATARGFEVAAEWQPELWARIHGGYSYLDVEASSSASATLSTADVGANARHQFFAWAALEPAARLEVDVRLRYVGPLQGEEIDGYLTGDARLGYRFESGLQLAIVGQSLFHERRQEFVSELAFLGLTTHVERSIFGVVTWQF